MRSYFFLLLLILLCTTQHQLLLKPLFFVLYVIALFFSLLLPNYKKNLSSHRFHLSITTFVCFSILGGRVTWSTYHTEDVFYQSQQTLKNCPNSLQLVSLRGERGLPYSYDMHLFAKGELVKPDYTNLYTYQNNTTQSQVDTSKSSKNSIGQLPENLCTTTPLPKKSQPIHLFSARYQGIPEGVLLGITDNIPKDIYQSFLDSGLVYLVAASGGNIAFLTLLLVWLLLFIPYKKRRWLQAGSVLGYGYVLRSNVALQRAVISSLVSTFLAWRGRKISPINLLLIVVVFCSLYNPYLLVTSRGFILSVAGVRGILHTPRNLQKYTILRIFAPSVRAFLALLGPLLLLTGKVNILTILASIPAGFITMVITYLSLFVLILGGGISFLSHLLYFCIKGLCFLTQFVADHGIYFTLENTWIAYSIRVILWFFIRSLKKYIDKRD